MKARKAMAYAAGAAFASLFTFAIALELVRKTMGHKVGAGYSGTEYSLCILDGEASAEILIGGDSRAKVQVNPAALDKASGRSSINIAQAFMVGGDIATLVNSLREYPRILARKPIIIVSITYLDLNDYALDWMPMTTMYNWTALDHARIAIRKPGTYFRFLRGRYLPALAREAMHAWRHDGFSCSEDIYRQPSLLGSRGYSPYHGRAPLRTVSDSGGFRLDGANWRVFQTSAEWLFRSPARAVIFINAPVNPVWRRESSPAGFEEMERRFSRQVGELAARCPKSRYLDFISRPLLIADSSHFYDALHLDSTGADTFTEYLGSYLTREFPKVGS